MELNINVKNWSIIGKLYTLGIAIVAISLWFGQSFSLGIGFIGWGILIAAAYHVVIKSISWLATIDM